MEVDVKKVDGAPTGSKKIRTDRLLKLADFLETVPRKSFDITSWQTRAPTRPEGDTPGECGFAGCAMGWAAHGKLFRGLSMRMSPFGTWYPAYGRLDGFDAASAVFDISADDSGFLFDGSEYPGRNLPTPKRVAKRIRKFVKDAEARNV